ncbi:MAG: hypothetical protein HS116_16225 [Planctomycetes bacterium]|nr:hypothetical protein [Planctomycetota bacterium]
MRRARILTGLLGALGLLCATAAAAATAADEAATPPKPPELAVVKTWGDLLKQPEIKLSSGTLIRLGMAADKAPLYDGVVVYLLSCAQAEHEDGVEDHEGLGPCQLKLLGGNAKEEERVRLKQEIGDIELLRRDGYYLYAQLIAVHEPGETRFEVRDRSQNLPRPQVCAVGRIEAGPRATPWSRFSYPVAMVEALAKHFDPELEVAFRGGTPALPRLNGQRPCALQSYEAHTALANSNEPLPIVWGEAPELAPPDDRMRAAWRGWALKLSAEDFEVRDAATRALAAAGPQALEFLEAELRRSEDPEARLRLDTLAKRFAPKLTLTQNGSCLILRSAQPFEFNYDLEPYLVRWWVNGQQVVPKHDVSDSTMQISAGAAEVRGVRLKLGLDPSAIGLKPGDRLGVQVAYCPHGTREIGLKVLEELKRAQQADELAFDTGPWLSNRLEFTYRAGDFPAPKETDEEEVLEAADADQ